MIRRKTQEEQRISAKLEMIIEEMGQAMRLAYKPYIAGYKPSCEHELQIPFTPHMQQVWDRYVEWCREHGKEECI